MGIQKIKIELIKVQKIFNWPTLKNLKKIYKFLGFINFN